MRILDDHRTLDLVFGRQGDAVVDRGLVPVAVKKYTSLAEPHIAAASGAVRDLRLCLGSSRSGQPDADELDGKLR